MDKLYNHQDLLLNRDNSDNSSYSPNFNDLGPLGVSDEFGPLKLKIQSPFSSNFLSRK